MSRAAAAGGRAGPAGLGWRLCDGPDAATLAAMRFEASGMVTHPAAGIVELMIERMEAIVPFLDDVASIALVERSMLADGRVRIVRRWQGSTTALPRALRPFLSDTMLGWLDTALWTPSTGRAEWTHATCSGAVAALYTCAGTTCVVPDDAAPEGLARISIAGNLVVHPDRIPGIPSFLASRLAPQVEAFVVNLIKPNLTGLAAGLQRYFDRGGQ